MIEGMEVKEIHFTDGEGNATYAVGRYDTTRIWFKTEWDRDHGVVSVESMRDGVRETRIVYNVSEAVLVGVEQ